MLIELQPSAPGASGTSLGFWCKQPMFGLATEESRRFNKIHSEIWQTKITEAGHKALNKIKSGVDGNSHGKILPSQSSNFSKESS